MIILETQRLFLRTWKREDIDPMTAINKDPKVCEFLPVIGDRASTEENIEQINKHYKKHGYSLYAVELKSTHEFIGWTGLAIPSFEAHFTPAVEVGWRLAYKYWGKGYATEAAESVLNYAFNKLNLCELVSFTAETNKRSRRVMEKIGMHHDLKDDFNHPKLDRNSSLCHHILYRVTKSDYAYLNRY